MFHHPTSSKQDYMSEVHPCSNTSYRPQMETTETNVWSVLYILIPVGLEEYSSML